MHEGSDLFILGTRSGSRKSSLASVVQCTLVLVQRRWLRIVIALGSVALLCQWLFRWQREHRYDPIIVNAARRYGVDPALVKAVVWKESRFNPRARPRR